MPRVVNLGSFSGLRPSWDDLYARRDRTNLFVTHAWIANWAAHFATDFAAVIEGDASRLEAGLAARRDGSVWRSLGDHSYRPEILVARPLDEVVGPLVDALHARASGPVLMINTPAGDDVRAAIDRAVERGAVVAVDKYERSLQVIDTTSSFDDYLAGRAKKVRQELRRKRRKLEREVRDARPTVWRDPADMDEAFAAVLDIETESWKDGAETSIGSSTTEERFYRNVLALDGDDIEPRVYTLADHGRPYAFILGVLHREVFYALKCSYRAGYAKLSPGTNLFGYLIEEACGDSTIERIELLGTDARWKRELATAEEPVCLLELYRRNLRSVAYAVGYQRVRPLIKELIASNPRLARLVDRVQAIAQARPSTIAEAIASARSRST